jgi:hypothetical protein
VAVAILAASVKWGPVREKKKDILITIRVLGCDNTLQVNMRNYLHMFHEKMQEYVWERVGERRRLKRKNYTYINLTQKPISA